MITLKGLAVIALLVGGTSAAIAVGGQPTTGQPSAPPGGNPAPTEKNVRPFHHPFLHRRVYMQAAPSKHVKMAPSSHNHKHIQMNAAPKTTKQ